MIEIDVRMALLSSAEVLALLGDRVHAMLAPSGTALPYITYQLIAGARQATLVASSDLRSARIQFNCWAASYAEAKALAEAAQKALAGSELFDLVFNGDQDIYDFETDSSGVVLDYSVWQ